MRLIDADKLLEGEHFILKCKSEFGITEMDVFRREVIDNAPTIYDLSEHIENAPKIDDLSEYSDKLWKLAYERGKSEGRKTGHWNYASFGNQTLVKCSECKEEFLGNGVSDYRFCPICGCRMVKEAEND